jgi:hypothetical protein
MRPQIPHDWSGDEARVVLEFLQELQDHVWMLYRQQIQDSMRAAPAPPPRDPSTPDDDSTPPF